MTNAEEKKERRAKGKGFPSIGLEDAFGLIKQGFSGGFDMSIETFAAAIDSSPKSGPFLSKIAALRDFGLVGQRIGFPHLRRARRSPKESPNRLLQLRCIQDDIRENSYDIKRVEPQDPR